VNLPHFTPGEIKYAELCISLEAKQKIAGSGVKKGICDSFTLQFFLWFDETQANRCEAENRGGNSR